jgi:hypothetical protein
MTLNSSLIQSIEAQLLPLDSPVWQTLSHAYGSAEDIPLLLKALAIAYENQKETWGELWSCLCHQGTVYSASFSAAPHLVVQASTLPREQRVPFIHLAGMIERGRLVRNGSPLTKMSESVYLASLVVLESLILDCLQSHWDEYIYKMLFSVLVTIRGNVDLGWEIDLLEQQIECPTCDTSFIAHGYRFDQFQIKHEGVREFRGDEPEYQKWCETHPLGFVVKIPLDSIPLQYRIHRVGCPELEDHSIGREMYVCYTDSNLSQTWFTKFRIHLKSISRCQTCF